MNQNKLSFKSENLVVDYITFKFQDLKKSKKKQIAKYFFKVGFNSYQQSGKLATPIKEPILISNTNKFQMCFVKNNSYWTGSLLHFTGSNAFQFYSLLKEQIIDCKILSSGTFSRLDIYHSRANKEGDECSSDFLLRCFEELQKTNKNVDLNKNFKGYILTINSRKSNNYFRIYQTENSLKFEYEMKGRLIEKFQTLLVENQLEEFEQQISLNFLKNFYTKLPIYSSYLDWLLIKIRKMQKFNNRFSYAVSA